MGDSISEGTLLSWSKQPGEAVKRDDTLGVVETDKVTIDIRAQTAGILKEKFAKEGDVVVVGADFCSIDDAGVATVTASAPAAAPAPKAPEAAKSAAAPAPSPIATPAKTAVPAAAPSPAPTKASTPAPAAPGGDRGENRVKMTRMRQTIAKRLKDSQNTACMLTTFNEIDMSNIMNIRNKYKDDFAEKHKIKIGFMSAFVASAARALKQWPDVNAYMEGQELVYHNYVDISVAVATPTGLVVPVIRNAEKMNYVDIERTIADFGKRARDGQIALEEMSGGTFTISNGGVFGSLMGTPIINPPQSAILGMHGIFKRPVAIDDKVEIRPMMYIALTYDHRIIDGSTAVQFLKMVKSGVEEPERLLMGL